MYYLPQGALDAKPFSRLARAGRGGERCCGLPRRQPPANPRPRAVSSLSSAARALDGHPDLNGIWQALGAPTGTCWITKRKRVRVRGSWAPMAPEPAGQSIVEGNEIPYQPWAAAKKKENFAKRAMADVSGR